jgi:hypothetical protein
VHPFKQVVVLEAQSLPSWRPLDNRPDRRKALPRSNLHGRPSTKKPNPVFGEVGFSGRIHVPNERWRTVTPAAIDKEGYTSRTGDTDSSDSD